MPLKSLRLIFLEDIVPPDPAAAEQPPTRIQSFFYINIPGSQMKTFGDLRRALIAYGVDPAQVHRFLVAPNDQTLANQVFQHIELDGVIQFHDDPLEPSVQTTTRQALQYLREPISCVRTVNYQPRPGDTVRIRDTYTRHPQLVGREATVVSVNLDNQHPFVEVAIANQPTPADGPRKMSPRKFVKFSW